MKKNGLSVKRIARINKPGRYGDGHGLYLQVNENGAKSWLLRWERGGRERYMGLGPLHTVDLDDARERARSERRRLLDGIDPLEAKRVERATRALAAAQSLTFEAAARQYFSGQEKGWRNAKHRAQFLSSLSAYAFPKIGRLSVGAIDTGLVLKVIEPIWLEKAETASRVRSRIERVLDWAAVRGYRTGDNPARWRGHLQQALSKRKKTRDAHHAALEFAALPEFMVALAARDGTAARGLEFLILTAARTGEVIGATWDEINLAEKLWTVPAARIKGGREHRVPLSDRAVALLKALPVEKGNPFVFIGPKEGTGLSGMAMAAILKRMNREDITIHGFRSTFRDWAAEKTTYQNHIIEMSLAHAVGTKVEAAYLRSDLFEKRRELMELWTTFCFSPPAAKGEVVPLRGRR